MQELVEVRVEFYREKEFLDTEVGRIPKDWEVKRLEEAIEKIQYGISKKFSDE